MRLIPEIDDFEITIEKFVNQADTILETHKLDSEEEEYEVLSGEYKEWQSNVIFYLENAFDEASNQYAREIKFPETVRFSLGNDKEAKQKIKEKLEDLSVLKRKLKYYIRLLKISDAIVRPEKINLEERKKFSTDEITELILEKLFELYDDSYHPVAAILQGNGIELKRHGEERELMSHLEDYGLIELLNAKDVLAKLTIQGRRHVENNQRKQVTNYDQISSSQDDLNRKIDEIIETLKMQNVGQEVLFEELQELKELYSKLGKKNWGQILKGKLIDLAVAQVINKEIMGDIFKELTNQVLLLK